MVGKNSPPWPQTPDGKIDWETVFEAPQTGLIALIVQARSPAALRKSTSLVIKSIYARGGEPTSIKRFSTELERMLPDDLPASALPKVATAIVSVLRDIKNDRIRREDDHFPDDEVSGDDEDAPKKERWWRRKKKPATPKKPAKKPVRKPSKGKGGRFAATIVVAILSLLGISGGGGYYYFFYMDREPDISEKTRILIDEMIQAAEGNGPEQHIFGWSLVVENRAGLTGVTAIGVPAGPCASAAWYFVNRGNVLINDRLPEKIAPNILRRFCEEKGQLAKLTWLKKASPGSQPEENTDTTGAEPNSGTTGGQ